MERKKKLEKYKCENCPTYKYGKSSRDYISSGIIVLFKNWLGKKPTKLTMKRIAHWKESTISRLRKNIEA